MSDTQRTAQAEVEHFSGTILKRNRDGVEVMSSTLEPGEELISGNGQSEVEEAGQAVEKADETQSIREATDDDGKSLEPTNDAGQTAEEVDAVKDEVAKNDPAEDKTETVVDPAADEKPAAAKTAARSTAKR